MIEKTTNKFDILKLTLYKTSYNMINKVLIMINIFEINVKNVKNDSGGIIWKKNKHGISIICLRQ